MRKREITVHADSEPEALRVAAGMLETTEDNLLLDGVKEDAYSVSLKNADAEIEMEISADGVQVSVISCAPPKGTGQPLTSSQIATALQEMGVTVTPVQTQLEKILGRINKNEDARGMALVRGEVPEQGTDSFLKLLGDLSKPLLPGMPIASKIPAQQPKSGKTVDGREIKPPGKDKAKDIAVVAQEGCRADENGNVFAEVYGLAQVISNRVQMRPLITASQDGLQAFACVYPKDFSGGEITPFKIHSAVEKAGIVAQVDLEAISAGIAKAKETGKPVDKVLVAKGVPPVDGADGELKLEVALDKSIGQEEADGSINYYERGAIHTVHAGDRLAVLLPPKKGVPGTDVFGAPILARDGAPASAQAGENVEFKSERGEFVAIAPGMILFSDGTISVSSVVEINSDIDFSTGNIRMEEGSISITGNIRSGFTVVSAGNLLVQESIEDARIEARGDVEVKHGVVMGETGFIKAGGNVRAHFAQNATIDAGHDVFVDNDLSNCLVTAQNMIVVTEGKGRIQGGVLRCGGGIEAKEVGSELNIRTVLIIGLPPHKQEKLIAEKLSCEMTVHKIDKVIGTGDVRAVLLRTPPDRRKSVAEVLKARIAARQRLKEIEEFIDKEKAEMRKQVKSRIKITGVIHPGVVVEFHGCHLSIEHAISASQLYYDEKTDSIKWAPL